MAVSRLKLVVIFLGSTFVSAGLLSAQGSPSPISPKVLKVIREGASLKKDSDVAAAATVKVENKISDSRLVHTEALVYSGCLPGDSYWTIPVQAGQRLLINASVNATCDSRGWSNDNWVTAFGPDGRPGFYVPGSPGYPSMPIGYLIGGINPTNYTSLDSGTWSRVFTPALPVDSHASWDIPINGFFYLIMNDTWSYGDNKGAVFVTITILPAGV